MSHDVFDPRKEWEHFDFPVEISNLEFEKNFHQLSGTTCSIRIDRDENLRLRGIIIGHTLAPGALDQDNREKGPGNFASLDTIIGYNREKTDSYTLYGCAVGSFRTNGCLYEGLGFPFTADLHFESFTKRPTLQVSDPAIPITRYEWFVTSTLNFFYPRMTRRFFQNSYQKIRVGLDEEQGSLNISPYSSSRDFFTVDAPGIKCIVSEVPKDCKLSWADCLCIEYRSSFGLEVEESTSRSLEFFLNFMFGTEIIKIGSTTIAGEEIICQKAQSPACSNLKHFCQNGSKPPIRFNEQYEWGRVQHLVDKYFPVYLEKDKHLDFQGILWRFFQAKKVPVGVNLPILSSALEKLCRNYLKAHPDIALDYIDETTFLALAGQEIEQLESKLKTIQDAAIIINKMKGAYKRGDNERLNLFFKLIDLPVNDLEKKAIKARNSMAHGGSDAKTMDKAKKLILHSRVYETLFHRVFLRILGYDQFYIDYYLPGTNSRIITIPTGPKKDM